MAEGVIKSLEFKSPRGLVVWDEVKNKGRCQVFNEP